MIWSIFPDKDVTLYERYPTQNTGLDNILELSKYVIDTNENYASRVLMKFDISTLSQSVSNGLISGTPQYFLNLFLSEAYQIPIKYSIEVYPVSQSWEMGIGKFADSPIIEEGVSWRYRDGETEATYWISGSSSLYATGTTGSYNVTPGGGLWYTDFTGMTHVASQSFSNESADLNINVTEIVDAWLSETIPNEGFLIKWSDASETTRNNIKTLKFYSVESHTVYLPKLTVKWDDSSFVTQSYWYTSSIYYGYTSSLGTQLNPIINVSTSSLFAYSMSANYKSSSTSEDKLIDYWYPITSSGIISSSFGNFTFSGLFNGNLSGSFTVISSSIGSGSGFFVNSDGISSVYYTLDTLPILLTDSGSFLGYYSGSANLIFTGSVIGIFSGSLSHENLTGNIFYESKSFSYPTNISVYRTTGSIELFATNSIELTSIASNKEIIIYPINLKSTYKQASKEIIEIGSRPKYIDKNVYVTSSLYKQNYYLPSSSYYAIKDAHSEDFIIDFDNDYTKLSCGGNYPYNYFEIWMNGLQPERNYRLLIKTVRNGREEIFDNKYFFKVVR